MSWCIANRRPEWQRVETETPLTYFDPDTGEIREHDGGFDGLIRSKDEAWDLLGDVAEALGPDVLKRWEDGDESLDLAAEVKERTRRAEAAVLHLERGIVEARATLVGATPDEMAAANRVEAREPR